MIESKSLFVLVDLGLVVFEVFVIFIFCFLYFNGFFRLFNWNCVDWILVGVDGKESELVIIVCDVCILRVMVKKRLWLILILIKCRFGF